MQDLHIPAYYDDYMLEPGTIPPQTIDDDDDDLLEAAAPVEPDDALDKDLVVDLPKEEDNSSAQNSLENIDLLDLESTGRLGIHYFADQEHYGQADLERWLPILQKLGINWIVLPAPLDRAIPQEFIDALVGIDVQPILHFNIPLTDEQKAEDLTPLFRAYAGWGVRYAVFFDRPNLRSNWPGIGWTQRDLVERFLSSFVPLAGAALDAGLIPVFPALEPGGDYWDTAFLRSALEGLAASGEGPLLESLALGAYAWTGDRPMTWGAGGPENWPATMPYHTPDGSQDQRGFRIFDWYNSISRTVLGTELPILILGAGVQRESARKLDAAVGTRSIKIAETLLRRPDVNANNAVPHNVLSCNFWLLSAAVESPMANSAWFEQSGKPTKAGQEWTDWRRGSSGSKDTVKLKTGIRASGTARADQVGHYLLLPGETELPLEDILDFLLKNNANVGTSSTEAAQAARVTLAGGIEAFANELIRSLIQAGCTLDHLPIRTV
ncbi:MAG: hypothetical protein WEC16_00905 [Anaerolineales bacterium]